MDFEKASPVRRRELTYLLRYVGDPETPGVVLLGAPGAGKTVLLEMLAGELGKRGRTVLAVSFLGLANPDDLGGGLLEEALRSGLISRADLDVLARTIRTSRGYPPLSETAEFLRRASRSLPPPVLILDGLDESPSPQRMASAVEELALSLDGWKIVVSSRPAGFPQAGRLARFGIVRLEDLSREEATSLLLEHAPDIPADVADRIVDMPGRNPLVLRLLAQAARDTALPDLLAALADPAVVISRLVNDAVSHSPDPLRLSGLFGQIALDGGSAEITRLIYDSLIHEEEIRLLLGAPHARLLVVLDSPPGRVAFVHAAVRDAVLARQSLEVRLSDLRFGSEEAERDELLARAFVQRRGMDEILAGGRSVIVGDRGAGKSAIFRRLAVDAAGNGDGGVDVYPVADAGDMLHRVMDKDAWLDVDALRAAWLVVAAAVAAASIPASAPGRLRRDAAGLRAALGLPAGPGSIPGRLLRVGTRLLGGTSLNLAVGPVSLQATLPAGSTARPGSLSVDIESFLRVADGLLQKEDRRAIVMLDRIDEAFKYDRARQQAIVQALLQAEGRVSLFQRIGLVVFLRTDIVELYDIQEKNKQVSRTLALDWSDDGWLQVLAGRVLANEPLRLLISSLYGSNAADQPRSVLGALFPPEIEGQPADRWLTDSLRNGNGGISPRLAVLLLHLAREVADAGQDRVAALPLFSAEAAGRAMTRLSELSFSEVVSDFKVAPSFVMNCRAGKLASFTLREVEQLFDESEGKVSEQVRLLERLGFLERIVQQTGSGVQSLFKIPRLYTRCWDYA